MAVKDTGVKTNEQSTASKNKVVAGRDDNWGLKLMDGLDIPKRLNRVMTACLVYEVAKRIYEPNLDTDFSQYASLGFAKVMSVLVDDNASRVGNFASVEYLNTLPIDDLHILLDALYDVTLDENLTITEREVFISAYESASIAELSAKDAVEVEKFLEELLTATKKVINDDNSLDIIGKTLEEINVTNRVSVRGDYIDDAVSAYTLAANNTNKMIDDVIDDVEDSIDRYLNGIKSKKAGHGELSAYDVIKATGIALASVLVTAIAINKIFYSEKLDTVIVDLDSNV